MGEGLDRHWQRNESLDFDVLLSSLGGGERRSAEYSGTKALMIAILEDGIRSYLSRVPTVRAEAEYWVSCRRRNFPFAFHTICETLGLEPDAVATALQRLRERNVSPRRAIRRSRPNVRRTGKIRLRNRRKTTGRSAPMSDPATVNSVPWQTELPDPPTVALEQAEDTAA